MILIILAIWFGYKKARDTGRNPYLWAAICAGAYIGAQVLVAVAFGFAIGIGIEVAGWSETLYDDLAWVITIVGIAASFLSIWLIFRYLDKIPNDEPPQEPPPPPTFDQSDQS
jgi:ABC-type glycerol-3-phosphate transport system permease component